MGLAKCYKLIRRYEVGPSIFIPSINLHLLNSIKHIIIFNFQHNLPTYTKYHHLKNTTFITFLTQKNNPTSTLTPIEVQQGREAVRR